MTLYLFLKNARERCNMTQEALAEKIGVSPTTIQNWERKTLPDIAHWPAILEQLNLSREEFFEHYENTALPDTEEENVSSFPDFLFPFAPFSILIIIDVITKNTITKKAMTKTNIPSIESALIIIFYLRRVFCRLSRFSLQCRR